MKLPLPIMLLAWLLITSGSQAQTLNWQQTTLTIGKHSLTADIAATERERAQGLMGRTSMADDEGMIFLFDRPDRYCFWMRNTLIPLSLAFLDHNGQIMQIVDMEPLSEQTHCATRPASYALEVNQGWFEARDISADERWIVEAEVPLKQLQP